MSRLKYIVKWLLNPFLVKEPEHLKVVALCIVVATTFWFFIAFNKTYTTVFSYPINYQYNQEKFIPINILIPNVEISLTGQGWDLLKEYFTLDKKYIDVELSNNQGKEIINESQLISSANKIFQKVKINNVYVDSIYCILDYKISKLITVNLSKDSIILNNGYSISSDIKIKPKEIYITGPESVISKINDTFQLKLTKEIDDDFDDEVKLNLPDMVLCDVEEVIINFDLSPYIEIEKEFTYSILGQIDTTLIFQPNIISGNCYLPENMRNSMNDSLIEIILDLEGFSFEKDTLLPISKIIKPDFIRKIILEDTMINIRRIND